jgi:hypothetical protein
MKGISGQVNTLAHIQDSVTFGFAQAGVAARLREDSLRKGTAHNLIRERDLKFAVAVNAEYVLARHMAGSEVNGNVNFLLRLTVWAFNRHHNEERLRSHAFPSASAQ